jgi:hypothetical protein
MQALSDFELKVLTNKKNHNKKTYTYIVDHKMR